MSATIHHIHGSKARMCEVRAFQLEGSDHWQWGFFLDGGLRVTGLIAHPSETEAMAEAVAFFQMVQSTDLGMGIVERPLPE